MLIGKFKTAYLQREVYYDAVVTGELKPWQLVTITEATATDPAQVAAAESLEAATHILAQSDVTATPYDHVPTELGRYDAWNYQDVKEDTSWKHVAAYCIMDKSDIEVQEVE